MDIEVTTAIDISFTYNQNCARRNHVKTSRKATHTQQKGESNSPGTESTEVGTDKNPNRVYCRNENDCCRVETTAAECTRENQLWGQTGPSNFQRRETEICCVRHILRRAQKPAPQVYSLIANKISRREQENREF